MGINLGGGQSGMTQKLLDYPQVSAAIKQVGGEGMAQHMGVNPLVYARSVAYSSSILCTPRSVRRCP